MAAMEGSGRVWCSGHNHMDGPAEHEWHSAVEAAARQLAARAKALGGLAGERAQGWSWACPGQSERRSPEGRRQRRCQKAGASGSARRQARVAVTRRQAQVAVTAEHTSTLACALCMRALCGPQRLCLVTLHLAHAAPLRPPFASAACMEPHPHLQGQQQEGRCMHVCVQASAGLPSTPLLFIAPNECFLHRTAPEPIIRGGTDPPPENVHRLRVLTQPGKGHMPVEALLGTTVVMTLTHH